MKNVLSFQLEGAEGQVNLSADIFYFLCVVFIASY